jgi:hypothetical protein
VYQKPKSFFNKKKIFLDKQRKTRYFFLGLEKKIKDNNGNLNKWQKVPCKLSRREGGGKYKG